MRKEVSRPEPVRRSRSRKGGAPVLLSPGLLDSAVLDQLCTHFVLTLTLRQAGRFAGRRDWNSLLSLTARHLVWPVSVLQRLRELPGPAGCATMRPGRAMRSSTTRPSWTRLGARARPLRGRHAVLLPRRLRRATRPRT